MYLVFARKYRPKLWEEVIGQPHIVNTIKEALSQKRIAHAYLFAGPRGTGKTSCARLLAKSLNCNQGPTPFPCNKCSSCEDINKGVSLDTIEIDGASNRGIEEIRNLRENVNLAPVLGKFRVYIIDEVHMLTEPAFNALLKTLEEPPSHAVFIFATTEWYKVPPTIRSRCQCFEFRLLSKEQIEQKIKDIAQLEGVDIEEEALKVLVTTAAGSLRDAESLLDQVFSFAVEKKIKKEDVLEIVGLLPTFKLKELISSILDKNTDKLVYLIEEIFSSGISPSLLLRELAFIFRDMLVLSLSSNPPLFSSLGEDIKIYSVSKKVLFECLDKLFKAQERLKIAPTLTYLTLELTLLDLLNTINKEEYKPQKEEISWQNLSDIIEKKIPSFRLFLPKEEEVKINQKEDILELLFSPKESFKKNILYKERERIKKIIEEEVKLKSKIKIEVAKPKKEDKEDIIKEAQVLFEGNLMNPLELNR